MNITEAFEYIPVGEIYPHPDNPRKDLGDLTELADSIKQNGIMQNLTVVPRESGGYTVIIGHRRLAAAKLAELETVPCVVADMDKKEQLRTMMMENMQRSDLTVYEQAQGFQLMLDMGDSIEDVARDTGFSEATIRRRTKLLDLDQEKFRAAQERGATLADYAELDKISNPKTKNELLDQIGTNNFANALLNAVNRETMQENKAEYLRELQTFAKEYKGDSVWKEYETAKSYSLSEKETVDIPQDAGEREYVYTVSVHFITLYGKKQDTQAQTPEQMEWQRVQEKKEALKEISNRTRQLRRNFVESVGVRTIREHMKQIVSILIYKAFDDSISLFWDSAEVFGLNKSTQEAVEKAVTAPERPLLKLAYCTLETNKDTGYFDFEGKYKEDEDLDDLYDFLTGLGYQMSDEEMALQDGSHELFQSEE